ncbi:hypothetical protein [Deinococcus aquaedulcis]|uniref:hypothetical protein n=1 Tax=Deinococcus aquaedulcis TaxID=2840455 RepID=UPI001C82F140|nr:hypothetical protein [Deinococcus aquaedulcis]
MAGGALLIVTVVMVLGVLGALVAALIVILTPRRFWPLMWLILCPVLAFWPLVLAYWDGK